MKATSAAFVATVMVLFLIGCSKNNKETAYKTEMRLNEHESSVSTTLGLVENKKNTNGLYEQKEESKPNGSAQQPMSSSAAFVDGKDSTHWFIRTAEAKFKVKDVAQATYRIEDITRQLGGYVSFTNLTSTVKYTNIIPVNADSSLRTTNYDVQNTMIIRVPNTQLDSALKSLAPLISYLDYRLVKANDAALQLLANRLKQARIAKHEERMNRATDEQGKKLNDISDAQEALLNRQEQADNAKIDNLSLTDQVKFSTINLSLYQPETVGHELVYNDKNIRAFQPALTSQLSEAAQFGWGILEAIIVFAVKIWPLIFIAIAMTLGYRRIRRIAL